MPQSGTVLVFGAHADDETIGCGGTIALLSDLGFEVVVVTFCWSEKGDWSDTGYATTDLKEGISKVRRDEALAADRVLGVDKRIGLGLPTQGIEDNRETYQRLVKIIRSLRPSTILTHNREDKHRDHRRACILTEEARWKASERVLADVGEPWHTPSLYFYEVAELLEHPSHLVDITATFATKMKALLVYGSQTGVLPGIARYVQSVAAARGYLRGTEFAEAFLDSHLMPYNGLPPVL